MVAVAFSTDSAVPPAPPYAVPPSISDRGVTWAPSHSAILYRVPGWGAPYFSINSNGNISVRPYGDSTLPHQEIDLLKVVKKSTGPRVSGGLELQVPLIVRFPDILKNRLEALQFSFDSAVLSQRYGAHYQGVYPVKCNQDKFVVDDIVKFGSGFHFGLEAGSKPELLLAMSSLCNGSPQALLVCNGFKDVEYISLALIAKKLRFNTVIVLEQEEELDVVVEVSKRLGLRPVIGLRAKLKTKHAGHFGSTSGENGKFGLNTSQILRVVKKLKVNEMLDCLHLLHFHIGSQIPSTAILADGVGEAAQIYCELVRLGAGMEVIDIGGGLGIDYDGSKSQSSEMSVAYNLQEYASAVVQTVGLVCDRNHVKHPVICSESGRALVSHHSILIFEAISSNSPNTLHGITPEGLLDFMGHLPRISLIDFGHLSSAVMRKDKEAVLFHAEKMKERCLDEFKKGTITMEQLAAVDSICENNCHTILPMNPNQTYNINLSVFTSIPDFWGFGQLFPIIPIHRLDEKPTVRAILSDLTCDSDGKVDKFINKESSLPLHTLDGNGGPYYLGMFLGGAYEEALGGFHNLFGGPSVVRISQSDGPHSFAITGASQGHSCADVLRVMQHEPEMMFERLKHRIEEFADDDISLSTGLVSSFTNMPYLDRGKGQYWSSASTDDILSCVSRDSGVV